MESTGLAGTLIPPVGAVETRVQVGEVRDSQVSLRSTFVFARDGGVLRSESTRRFRGQANRYLVGEADLISRR